MKKLLAMKNTSILFDKKYVALKPFLNERARRLWAAAEAISLGRGGKIVVSTATGLSRTTVNRGISELGQFPDDP
jgi:hypothetical protein